jgi:AbrB family looped-hinge helix DNA binding protein
MSRITSKLQVTLPKLIATEYGLKPGSEVTFEPAGEVILVRTGAVRPLELPREDRLRILHEMIDRANQVPRPVGPPATDRGWTREELYDRDVRR